MYRNFEITQPCLLVLFLATSIILSCVEFTRNFTDVFFEVSGSETNDLLVYPDAEDLKNSTIHDLRDKTYQTKLLADVFETRINKITHLLEVTSGYPAVRNISYANQIGEEFMGIPES